MRKILTYITIPTIVLITVFFTSCVKDIDFDQVDEIVITPVIESSLIYFDEPASSFVTENGNEQLTIIDTVRIEAFGNEFAVDNLIKTEFIFEAKNDINRAYEAKVDFLNDVDEIQHTFTFLVPNASLNQDIEVEHIEIFENESLEALKATTQLVFTLTLLPSPDGSTLNNNSPGRLKFRSKAIFYLKIDTST